MKQWEKDLGIGLEPTEAYNSLQNGPVERSIQTLEDSIRAMLKEAKMSVQFWPKALEA